jgi:hypothetical protein
MVSWRKSTYSDGNGGSCVEVAGATRVVLIRDTKDRDGGTLKFSAEAWRAFAEQLKRRLARGRVQHLRGTHVGCPCHVRHWPLPGTAASPGLAGVFPCVLDHDFHYLGVQSLGEGPRGLLHGVEDMLLA